MSRNQEYDWAKLKFDYFTSDYLNVNEFFKCTMGKYTQGIRDNTTGWKKEKQEYQKKITDKALSKAANKTSTQMADLLVEIDKAEINGIKKLIEHVENKYTSPGEIIKILEHFKIQKGEMDGIRGHKDLTEKQTSLLQKIVGKK